MTRNWDAASYDQVGAPMTAMAAAVIDRLDLAGDETVLDVGCGTGRGTELLLERLSRGRVVAVDADPDMVGVAADNLGDRAAVLHADVTDLGLDEPVDAILSTATFHWILDHPRLFSQLFTLLRPGGQLVAQCGGEGNIAELRSAADDVATEPGFAPWFAGWRAPWYYAGPNETAERLATAGFTDIRTWLLPWPITAEDPAEYLATVTLGAQVQRLPESLRHDFVQRVLMRLDKTVTIDYVRLNIDARRP